MTAQQIFDKWKEIIMQQTAVPKAAEKFVLGEDGEYGNIPKGTVFFTSYPDLLVKEADSADAAAADIARRGLRALGKMNLFGIIVGSNFETAEKAGFPLDEIIETGIERAPLYTAASYLKFAKNLLEYYIGEAETLITPAYLKKLYLSQKHDTSRKANQYSKSLTLAYFIAKELIKENRGDVKGLCSEIINFAENSGNSFSAAILYGISEYDSRADEIMRKLIREPVIIKSLSELNTVTENVPRNVCERLGMKEYYLYAAVTGLLGEEEEKAAAREIGPELPWLMSYAVNRDEAAAGNFMEKIRTALKGNAPENEKAKLNEKNVFDVCKLAYPIAVKAKAGGDDIGKVIAEYEKNFTEMIVMMRDTFIADKEVFNGPAGLQPTAIAAAELMYADPEKAARCISLYPLAEFLRLDRRKFITVFSQLYDCSEKAHNVMLTFLMSAKYHEGMKNHEKVSEIMSVFLSEQKNLGEDLKAVSERIISEGVPLKTYFMSAALAETDPYWENRKAGFAALPEIVKENSGEAIAFYSFIRNEARLAAFWADMLYNKTDAGDVPTALEMMKSKSKNVRKTASDVLSSDEERFRAPLEEILPKLKGEALTQAQGMIKKWDNSKKYGKDFSFASNALAEEYVKENPNPAAEKKVSFIPEEYFADVRFADMDGKASKELVRYIVSEYLVLDEPYRIAVCDKLAEKLYAPDLQAALENMYQFWLENGADNKTKSIMIPYCVYASDTQILALKKQLVTWAEASRGALGAYVINAVAVNGGSAALMTVNDIGVKFNNNMVKKAARAAFSYAAKALGVPEDVLADRIVPTLGLDRNGEKVLDFGSRTFTLSLMPDLTLSYFDNAKNKEIKSLPKTSAEDDAIKAEEAKKYVSELKKQLKAVTASQKARLESVFANGRTWSGKAWEELFVNNPVMHRFASNLIWGIYGNGALKSSFRYQNDGTFCDENDNAFTLPESAEISLVHPVEMSAGSVKAWQEQLSDYEIAQPFPQISANVITLEKGDVGKDNYITKYRKRTFTVGSMNGAAKKHNFIRSSVEDAGGFSGYHIQDKVLGIGVKFGFENMYMGQDFGERVELTEVYFYTLPEDGSAPSSYEEYAAIPPESVSRRFISCCLNILENILE